MVFHFYKKPTPTRIATILNKEGFIYTAADIDGILKGNQKGRRYGNAVLVRNENGVRVRRFIKIPIDENRKTYQLFRRQASVGLAFQKNKIFEALTASLIKTSFGGPIPYAIFEALEVSGGSGYYADTAESYAAFTAEDVTRLVDILYSFHRSGISMNKNIFRYVQNLSSPPMNYIAECEKIFSKKVRHRYRDGAEVEDTVERLLEHYTGVPDVRKKIIGFLRKKWEYMQLSAISGKELYLIHGDLQLDNIYRDKNGAFKLLDFEWIGRADNPALAIMYDYGYLRARAWFSPSFQSYLDKAMSEVGTALYKNSEMVAAALMFGVVRSALLMSQYHLDFINTVTKGKHSEERYVGMYSSMVRTLVEALKND